MGTLFFGNHLTVQNDGIGNAGDIEVNADQINLDNSGRITATSASGQGGNIELNTDQLQLIDESKISTSAEGLGNGGNITIDADTLVAINDSDITATAVQGDGGNINITSGAILGIEERRATPGNGTSDIDASSEFGEDGTVTISDPQVFIQDPLVFVKDPNIEITDPKLTGYCPGATGILKDERHENRPARPDDIMGGIEHAPEPDFIPPPEPSEPMSLEDLLNQQGEPMGSADKIVATADGKIWLVVKSPAILIMRIAVKSQYESLKRRGCLPEGIQELEELETELTFPAN